MGVLNGHATAFLIDTQVLLWWLFDEPKLSEVAYDAVRNPENKIFVSSVSGWEIATKDRLGKLPHAREAVEKLPVLLQQSGMNKLPITLEHGLKAGSLPAPHKDPFDKMLVAQGQLEKLPMITSDAAFRYYDIPIVW